MTTSQNETYNQATTEVFADPVAYLAAFGIESELVAETKLATAA